MYACAGRAAGARPLGAMGIEGVHLGPRGVVAGDVERVEIVPVAFDLGPLGHGEPHLGEDRGHLLRHLADGMDGSSGPRSARQRHVQPFVLQPLFQCGIGKRCLLGGKGRVDLVLEVVELRPHDLAFLRAHPAQFAHPQADFTLLSQRPEAQVLKRGLVGGGRNLLNVLVVQVVHFFIPLSVRADLPRLPRQRKREA